MKHVPLWQAGIFFGTLGTIAFAINTHHPFQFEEKWPEVRSFLETQWQRTQTPSRPTVRHVDPFQRSTNTWIGYWKPNVFIYVTNTPYTTNQMYTTNEILVMAGDVLEISTSDDFLMAPTLADITGPFEARVGDATWSAPYNPSVPVARPPDVVGKKVFVARIRDGTTGAATFHYITAYRPGGIRREEPKPAQWRHD